MSAAQSRSIWPPKVNSRWGSYCVPNPDRGGVIAGSTFHKGEPISELGNDPIGIVVERRVGGSKVDEQIYTPCQT